MTFTVRSVLRLFVWIGAVLMMLSASVGVAAPLVTCTSAGDGLWSISATWSGCDNDIPQVNDTVVITSGHTVTVDTTTASLAGLTVDGALTFDATGTGHAMQVTGNLTINNGGTLNVDTGGSATTHSLTIGGNLSNDGTFNASPAAGRIVNVTFNGNNNQTVSGSGATNRFSLITINNSGSDGNNIIEVTSNNFTASADFLTLISGILKVSGTFTLADNFFSSASYSIPAGSGLWLNNANVTVTAQHGSATLNGLLRISQGTYNVGTSSGNSLQYKTGAVFTMEGGALNSAGRFHSSSPTQVIVFSMSGGMMTVATVGQGSTEKASFDISDTDSSFTMTGGTIVIQNESTTSGTVLDYRNVAGTVSISGGTVQFGNGSTSGSPSFEIGISAGPQSVFPTLVINGTGTPSVNLNTDIVVNGDVALGSGTILGANAQNAALTGNWTNNGAFIQGTSTVTFNGSSVQAIDGTSSTTFYNLTINNGSVIANGVGLGTAQTVNGTLALIAGFLKLNANDLTLGTSAAIAGTPSTSNMVVADDAGYLKKTSDGSFSAFVFPIGDSSGNYTPVTLNCSAFTSGQTAGFSVTDATHPNMNSNSHLTRYWTLSTAVATPTCTGVVFQYVQGDVSGTESEIRPVKWNGSNPWYPLANAAINSSGDTLSGDFSTINDGQAIFSGGVPGTLSVQVEYFETVVKTDHILLRWETVNEVDNQGFYLYRALDADGPWTQLTPHLIPSQSPGSPWGFVYEWVDRDVVFGERYRYRLASMDMAGLAEVVDTTEAQYGEWARVWVPMVGR